ncbi:MAG: ABC transporter ATP-binding protein, partial [Desulfobacterales bacterium]
KPDSGVVKINGQDVTNLGANKRAELRKEEIGFIFQFFALIPVLNAYENVELPLLLNGVGAKERKERAMSLLDAVGLSDRTQHRPDQLSGGEQQRVAIARALVNRPPVILADEPTAPLDSERALAVIGILNQMARQYETAIIVVTHDEKIIPTFKRIYHIRDGQTHEAAGEGKMVHNNKNGPGPA